MLHTSFGLHGRDASRNLAVAAVLAGLAVDGVRRLARHRARFRLEGRNALVTGGSRGLGLEIARVLVDRGAHVAIVARDAAEIERAVAHLRGRSSKVRVVGIPADLSSGTKIAATIEQVRAALGPIDVLVNNAGLIEVGPLDTNTEEDFEAAMRVHCFGPLRLMLGLRDDMRRRGGGRIANIASIGGSVAVSHRLPYSTSKFALIGLSKAMRAELAGERIFVSTSAPEGLSMPAPRAARIIVRSLEDGAAHAVVGLPAKAAAIARGLFSNPFTALANFAESLLPPPHSPYMPNKPKPRAIRLPAPAVALAPASTSAPAPVSATRLRAIPAPAPRMAAHLHMH